MIIGSRQRVNASQDNMDIRIDDREVKRVHSTKSLGLHIDSHLTWSVHIEKVCKMISSAIGALKRIRSFITTKTAVEVYFALIQPHFDYCCSVWDGLGETLSTKIQKLQNRAVRVITRSSYDTNASVLLNALQLDNLYVRRRKLKAQLMFKILKGNMPSHLRTLFSICNTEYNLRNNQFKLNLPKPRTNYLKRRVVYRRGVLARAERLAPPMTSSFLNLFRLALIYISLFNILERLLFVYLRFICIVCVYSVQCISC